MIASPTKTTGVSSALPAVGPSPRTDPARASGDGLEALSFYLGRAYYAYVGLLERVLAEHDLDGHLRPGMGHVVFALFEQDDCIIKDLVLRTSLSPSTLTGILNRMELLGVVERRRDAADRRAVRVRLTPLGRSLRPRCEAVACRINEILARGLGASQVTDLKLTLARMNASLRAAERELRAAS